MILLMKEAPMAVDDPYQRFIGSMLASDDSMLASDDSMLASDDGAGS